MPTSPRIEKSAYELGHCLVVRNGHAEPRPVKTVAGAVQVKAPRVNDKRVDQVTGEKMRFRSLDPAALGPQVPEGGRGAAVDVPARDELGRLRPCPGGVLRIGGRAVGLGRHPAHHGAGRRNEDQFARRSLRDVDYVYVFADGIHFNVRLEEARLCALVIVGVRADGTKELVSISDGHRESTESWADVLRGLRRRGMTAPVLAVGDGALGFWGALSEVFPETAHQRCWLHKSGERHERPAQVGPARGPSRPQGGPRRRGQRARRGRLSISFVKEYEAKWPKATEKISDRTGRSCWPSTTSRPSTGST